MRGEDSGAVAAADVLFRAARPAVLVGFAADDIRDLLIQFRAFLVRQKFPVLVTSRPLQRLIGVSRPDALEIRLAPGRQRTGARRRLGSKRGSSALRG